MDRRPSRRLKKWGSSPSLRSPCPAEGARKRSRSQKKRAHSGTEDDTQHVRCEISDGIQERSICTVSKKKATIQRKIKVLIGERMDILVNDSFNEKLRSLKARIEQIESRTDLGKILRTLLRKVSKLERHLRAVLAYWEKEFSQTHVQQTSNQSFSTAMDPFVQSFLKKSKTPALNPKTIKGLCTKSKGDCTVRDPDRDDPQCASLQAINWICSMKALVTNLHPTGIGKTRAMPPGMACCCHR